ncbi:MAG: glycosyltransferase family 39 protein [Phycisphaerales bacterium]|nr:MAG: glycosyltransferase family 39 protein [Phycisphaerales bacterium]
MVQQTGDVSPFSVSKRASIKGVLIVVTIVALLISALSFSASQLWSCPDTTYYVRLAGGIADNLNFTDELFLIRPPGYPLMLAAIFALFGANSPIAILIVQYVLVVGITLVTVLTAWHLTYHRGVCLVAGLMCACSLQLLAFANMIITEVPYTFALVLSVYFLVKYHRLGHGQALALASLMAGVSYLIRPIGMTVVALCVVAVLHRAWKGWKDRAPATSSGVIRRSTSGFRRARTPARWRRAVGGLTLAVAPAMIVALPAVALNRLVHGSNLSGLCSNLALYHRIAAMDRLDSTESEAMGDIHAVVDEAIEQGHLAPDADFRQWGVVWRAYEKVRNVPLAESSAVIGQAARDLVMENLRPTLELTVRYSYWMIMVPDWWYRFHPGGTPGIVTETGECRADITAEIFDVATYEPMLSHRIHPYDRYLPLTSEPRATTPLWSGIARWFYRHIQKGPPLVGLGDSPYEEFCWLCLFGMLVSLVTRARMTWLLVTGVVFLQVVVSAWLAGPTPRYAVPVAPLMLLYAALFIVAPVWLTAAVLRFRRAPIASAHT